MEQILLHFPQKEPTSRHLNLGLPTARTVKENNYVV